MPDMEPAAPEQAQDPAAQIKQVVDTVSEGLAIIAQLNPESAEMIDQALSLVQQAVGGSGPEQSPQGQATQLQESSGRPVGPAGV